MPICFTSLQGSMKLDFGIRKNLTVDKSRALSSVEGVWQSGGLGGSVRAGLSASQSILASCNKRPVWSEKTVLCNEIFETLKRQTTGPKSRHVHAFRYATCFSDSFSYLPVFLCLECKKQQPATQETQHAGDVISVTLKEHVKRHVSEK